MAPDDDRCHCGEPLHYTDPDMRRDVEYAIELTGQRYIPVVTPEGTFLVDKHYIALHGIKGGKLSALGFVRQPDTTTGAT